MEQPCPSPELRRTVDLKEEAALERRQWVRVSHGCNNRCRFCLDVNFFRGDRFVSPEEVKRQILGGREEGATRLILSGGEASIHPQFLDFLRYGREAGYDRVQTITNGRMFAYRRFLKEAVEAGLGEVTFSLHSHIEPVFEELTGVPGSYEQAMAGLRAALDTSGLIVSVDIVINRANVEHLPQMVEFFADLGVTEFDLLHLVPFGRAYDEATRTVPLAAPGELLKESLHRTILLGVERGLVLWTNRLPPPLLEGHEHLIQDPHKLIDEIRGRHEHVHALVEDGSPLPCRDARCADCYLAHYCDLLHPIAHRVARRNLPNLRVSLCGATAPSPDISPFLRRLKRLWLRAPGPREALSFPSPGVPEIWELESCSSDSAREVGQALEVSGRRLERLLCPGPDEAVAAALLGAADLELPLDRKSLDWLWSLGDGAPGGISLGLGVPERLSECLSSIPSLTDPRLRALSERGVILRGLPPCLGGPLVDLRRVPFVDLEAIDQRGHLDPDRHVALYAREGYRVHSLRCGACSLRRRCAGLPVNLVRAQGFGMLVPR
jgi:pyruvate-formate lyase-activating enzyme